MSGRGGLILFFSGQFQGKECDVLKGSSCRLTLQELQVYGDGLHLLGAGGWWHPIPGMAWGGDGCSANSRGKNDTWRAQAMSSGAEHCLQCVAV